MKKTVLQLPLFVALGLILTFSSCKKATTETPNDSTSAIDASIVGTAVNSVTDDAAIAADQVNQISNRSISGSTWTTDYICGATIDSSSGTSITINYNGTECSGLTRSGTVTITLISDTGWRQKNAQILIAVNVSIVDNASKNHYSFTGNDTITNETGGLAYSVFSGSSGPVNRRHTGSMQITFPDGNTRTWTTDRTISWTYASGVVSSSLYSEAAGNVGATGTDRYGRTFTSVYTNPILDNSHTCSSVSYFYPYAGLVTHTIDGNRAVTVQYGTNASGSVVGTSIYCPASILTYGIYISYTNISNNNSAKLFVPYWD